MDSSKYLNKKLQINICIILYMLRVQGIQVIGTQVVQVKPTSLVLWKKNKILYFCRFYLLVRIIINRIFTYILLAQTLYVSKVNLKLPPFSRYNTFTPCTFTLFTLEQLFDISKQNFWTLI